MTVETWPFTHRALEMDWALVGGAVRGGGGAGPNPVGASLAGPHWRLTLNGLTFLRRDKLLAARAFQGRLDCGATPVIIPACDGNLRPVTPGGTVTAEIAEDATGGTDTLKIALSDDYLPLRGGEHFSIDHDTVGRRMYRVTEILGGTEDEPQVLITPFLRQSVAIGVVCDFMDPSCTMHLESGFQLPVEHGRWSSNVEAVFREWFDSGELVAIPGDSPSSPPDGGDGGDPPGTPVAYGQLNFDTDTGNLARNRILLLQITLAADVEIQNIHFVADETDAGAKLRPVIFSDNGSDAPLNQLADGPPQVGITAGVEYDLALSSPPTGAPGEKFWIGFHFGYAGSGTIRLKHYGGGLLYPCITSVSDNYDDGTPATWPGTTNYLTTTTWVFWATGETV